MWCPELYGTYTHTMKASLQSDFKNSLSLQLLATVCVEQMSCHTWFPFQSFFLLLPMHLHTVKTGGELGLGTRFVYNFIWHHIIALYTGSSPVTWSQRTQETQVVRLSTIDNIGYRPPQLPMAVPRDLADTLLSFHGHPFVWFVGQILKYLMRPNKELESYIDERRKALGFKHPIVG